MLSSQGEVTTLLTAGLIWMLAFWLTYFPFRVLANRAGKIYSIPFFANMLLGVYFFLIVQPRLLNSLGLNSQLLSILGIIMAFALLIHHLSEEGEAKFKRSKKLKLIHHQISHLVFFIAFGISSMIIAFNLLQMSERSELSLVVTYLIISLFSSVVGILVGLNQVRLKYA